MAWDVKYRLEFKDFFGVTWKVDISDETAATTITELSGKSNPLIFNFLSNGDGVTDYPVKGSTVDIQVYSNTNFQHIDFYSFGNLTWKVQIYYGSTLFWQGFINSDGYEEPYDQPPYYVTLQASDGLGQLKNIQYKDGDDYYNGRMLESQIIIDILTKIGFTGFTEYVNLYEDGMANDVTDSVFDQCKIDMDVFKDMYCYEVLEAILKKYNACIRQQNGEMIIYRPFELKSATVKGRKFTAATTKTAATDLSANQYINRTGNASDIHSVDGGALRIQAPARKVILHQDFGNKDSWIDNWQFKAETFASGDFDFWERYNNLEVKPVGEYVKGEKDGIAITPVVSIPLPYIIQEFGSGAITSLTDSFVLEFEYGYFNDSSGTINDVDVILDIRQGAKHLGEDGTVLIWTTDWGKEIRIRENIAAGWSGWTKYEKSFTGLDSDGIMTIATYGAVQANAYVCLKNIRLYAVSSQVQSKKVRKSFRQRIREKDPSKFIWSGWGSKYSIINYVEPVDLITEQTYEIDNEIEGNELDYDFVLGDVLNTVDPDPGALSNNIDNIIEQFAGSLAKWVGGILSLTESWSTRGESEALPLLELIGKEIAYQQTRPKQLLTLPIHERNIISNDPQIKLIGNFQDNINQYDGQNRIFVLNSAQFTVEERTWQLELVEIDQDEPPAPPEPGPLSAPVATDATFVDETEFTANWETVTGAIRYYLDVSESNVFANFVTGYENKDVGNNLSHKVEGLDSSTTYYYRVRAYDIWGQTSASSNTITTATLGSATYQLYTDSRFWLTPESETWTVLVYNLSTTVGYNNNFRLKLIGTADSTPVTYTAITSDVVIAASDSEFIIGTWDVEISGDFDWDEEYTLSIEYDEGTAEFVMLASKTYN